MYNPESEEKPDTEQVEKPREAGEYLHIDSPIIMAEQFTLMRLMVPESMQKYVKGEIDSEHLGIHNALFDRWVLKYSVPFRAFCDSLDPENPNEQGFAERIVEGKLTSDDYSHIQNFLEDSRYTDREAGTGGAFFENETDMNEFLKGTVL